LFNIFIAYLNIIIVLRKNQKIDTEELEEYRAELVYKSETEISLTNKNNIINGLPTMDDLINYTNSLYNDKKYKEYIVNYLLLATNCRNKDLNCYITDKDPVNSTDNFLVVKDDYVSFVRNDYKTVKTHGTITNTINSVSFIYACNSLLYTWLLPAKTNISSYVANMTYNKIGQGRYFKIAMINTDKSNLIKVGQSRGTNVSVLLSHYDINRVF